MIRRVVQNESASFLERFGDLSRTNRRIIVYQNLDLYRLPNPRFISYTKTQINIEYQNLDLYRIPKPRFISYTKTQINIEYQNLDLYRFIPKPRFISYTKTQIYIVCQNLDLYRIPRPRFIQYSASCQERLAEMSRTIRRVVQYDSTSCLQ